VASLHTNDTGCSVVAIGEVLWDMLPGGRQMGGAPANCAAHAARLGASAALVSRVGRDADGEELLARLSRLGVSTSAVSVDDEHRTGRVTVDVSESGEPRFAIEPNAAWDFIAATPAALDAVAAADAICCGTLAQRSPVSRRAIRDCIEAAGPHCLKVFDVNLRDPFVDFALVAEMLDVSDVVKLNEQEMRRFAEWCGWRAGESEVLHRLVRTHPLRLVALTKGGSGSRLRGRDAESVHPGYRVEVVDTVGAGDSFTAALIVGLLAGHPLDRINDEANRIASSVCSRAGACPI
jgi:fructokinase